MKAELPHIRDSGTIKNVLAMNLDLSGLYCNPREMGQHRDREKTLK